jgi:hypothetical protein
VVAEGGVTEIDYCTALNNAFGEQFGFRINNPFVRANGLKPLDVAERAIQAAGSGESAGSGADSSSYPLKEVWALFDRDQHQGIREAFAELKRHNAGARERGMLKMEVAFSHPSFDLWLLLHFQPLATPQGGASDTVRRKLREYPGFESFGSDGKKITHERAARLMALEHIGAAVKYARALVGQCPTGGCSPAKGHVSGCDPLRRDPSTDVWRLIESLGIVPHNQ